MNSITRKWQYYSYKENEKSVEKTVNVKKSARRMDFRNVEKISFYIPIYDNTQFILQSLILIFLLINRNHIFPAAILHAEQTIP